MNKIDKIIELKESNIKLLSDLKPAGKNYGKYQPDKFEKYFTEIIDENSYFKLK